MLEITSIPTMIKSEIPFPIPLSVIFSPNHMANIVPVTKITEENKNSKELNPNKNALLGRYRL
jgi:hypothetical protein